MGDAGHRDAICPRIAYMPQGLGKNLYPDLSIRREHRVFRPRFSDSRAPNGNGGLPNFWRAPDWRRSPTVRRRNYRAACGRSSACAAR